MSKNALALGYRWVEGLIGGVVLGVWSGRMTLPGPLGSPPTSEINDPLQWPVLQFLPLELPVAPGFRQWLGCPPIQDIIDAITWAKGMREYEYKPPFLDEKGEYRRDEDGDIMLDLDTSKSRDERNFFGLCLAFVVNVYNKKFRSYKTAKVAADALGAKNNPGRPPEGAWVFYDYWHDNKNLGHAALSIGDEVVHVSTSFALKIAKVKVEPYKKVEGAPGYIGWAWPK